VRGWKPLHLKTVRASKPQGIRHRSTITTTNAPMIKVIDLERRLALCNVRKKEEESDNILREQDKKLILKLKGLNEWSITLCCKIK
jgi:hypothetical protein